MPTKCRKSIPTLTRKMGRSLKFLFIYEPLAELGYTFLRWADNRRKGKTVSEFWSYVWAILLYGEINGRVPLADIENGWRKGTWFEFKGKKPGWQGPVYLDTEYGTLYKGRKILKDTRVDWPTQ